MAGARWQDRQLGRGFCRARQKCGTIVHLGAGPSGPVAPSRRRNRPASTALTCTPSDLSSPGGTADPARRTNVPESLLGYVRQLDRALVHLLRSPGADDVSLEVLGDTAVRSADGTLLTEEAKSRTGSANPVANRAGDLWKTLRNWIEAAEEGRLDPDRTVFQLYVSRPFEGEIATRLAESATPEEAEEALGFALQTLGVDLESPAPCAALAEGIRGHAGRILEADPSIRRRIIARFRIEVGTGEAEAELLDALDALMVSDSARVPLMHALRGWVQTQVVRQLERGQPALITRAAFRGAFIEYRRRIETRAQLLSVAAEPSDDEMARELELGIYVKQLDLIEVEDEEKVDAVIQYLVASADRVAWAEEARVFEDDLLAFERELKAMWRRERRQCDIEHRNLADVERGTLVYGRCLSHRSRLAGLEVPDGFCRGSFHKLANDLVLGWHPDYMHLLNGGGHGPNEGHGS